MLGQGLEIFDSIRTVIMDAGIDLSQFEFNIGWKQPLSISWFNESYDIVLKLQAYSKNEKLTKEQVVAYTAFKKNEVAQIKQAEQFVKKNSKANSYTPTMVVFKQNGEYALLCDDKDNPDEGVAIMLAPTVSIVSQDDYL